jgi:DNA-directed RNA polymerase subunit M/transcription elongation factor TFIIS
MLNISRNTHCIQLYGADIETDVFINKWQKLISERPTMTPIHQVMMYQHMLMDAVAKPPKAELLEQHNAHKLLIRSIGNKVELTNNVKLDHAMELFRNNATVNTDKIDFSSYVKCRKCGEKRGIATLKQNRSLDEGADQMVVCEVCAAEIKCDHAL